jgi:hypothetical protein
VNEERLFGMAVWQARTTIWKTSKKLKKGDALNRERFARSLRSLRSLTVH